MEEEKYWFGLKPKKEEWAVLKRVSKINRLKCFVFISDLYKSIFKIQHLFVVDILNSMQFSPIIKMGTRQRGVPMYRWNYIHMSSSIFGFVTMTGKITVCVLN